ncbi:potassium channel family protein [Thalassotalea sp. PS06]|uniref:potassium channel family protein n=1 Tax=Thalassotalea sp. PS06 TaxID=2594005 RepID=UPI001162FA79|nr:potassium channel family protein [Thalassotalea sp. PS06]QDP02090.1 potassium channel protein [Thalassotalea sp. PS06]
MSIFLRLKQLFLRQLLHLPWQGVLLLTVGYIALSWILLTLSGESELVQEQNFLYFLMVTASTVGYGDFSPQSQPGKYVVALFIIPAGLSLFGLLIGRVIGFFSDQWRKGVKGLKTLNYDNHILVIGWNEGRTMQLLKLLKREMDFHSDKQDIALCVRADIENPQPEQIGFVRVLNFTSDEEMDRAGVSNASCIVIDTQDDDVTMTTALYCASRNPDAHTIAYFQDDQLGNLLKQHCPNIECMPSVGVELIAKSAVDPGSSLLHHQLLDVGQGMTQYSLQYQGKQALQVAAVFIALKKHYQATLIGISPNGYDTLELNPDLEKIVAPDSTLYYIADERLNNINWELFTNV